MPEFQTRTKIDLAIPLASFLLCIAFFTRIPLPTAFGKKISPTISLKDATHFFPIVGLVIGILTGIVWTITASVLPSTVAAGLAIGFGCLLTGALHEDGLADCADGLGATSNREKALDIMRDSRIGTYGALALVLSVGLRWTALASLSPVQGFAALIIAHTVSRSAMALAMRFSKYARQEGLGKMVEGKVSNSDAFTALATPLLFAIVLAQITGFAASFFAYIAAVAFLLILKKRLGGFTGDGLGAMQQTAEITALIILAGIWA